jgi:hypothetical protein
MAFAHHGLNVMGGRPAAELLQDLAAPGGPVVAGVTIGEIAGKLRRTFAEVALHEIAKFPAFGVGFWVVGFGAGPDNPKLYEVHWPRLKRSQRCWPPVFAGEGASYIRDQPPSFDDALYQTALAEQDRRKETVFGGRRHRLVIRSGGCEWIERPGDPLL